MYLKSYLEHKKGVSHVTLNPRGFGFIRLHLIPPKPNNVNGLSLLYINGNSVLPLYPFESKVVRIFFSELRKNVIEGEAIEEEQMDKIISNTIKITKLYYPRRKSEDIKKNLFEIINISEDIALKKEVQDDYIIPLKLKDYKKFMTAPHRMDLVVSSMVVNNSWNCNLKCKNCYANSKDQNLMIVKNELSTVEWKKIIDICQSAGIPQLTFTGGEPLTRNDIPELIDHSKWHVTRLNTNGINLTKDMCSNLRKANLDMTQITLYSYDENIHDNMVSTKGAFKKTINGLGNALEAGLFVSVNTPLSKENFEYKKTLEFLNKIGVKYTSSSGLIPAGGAINELNNGRSLTKIEMLEVIKDAVNYGKSEDMEMAFTSPGWLSSNELSELSLDVPSCGACLTNMAVSPKGEVIPCQSWLKSEDTLGNILNDSWKNIWNRASNKLSLTDEEELNCPLLNLKEGENVKKV